MEYYSLGVYRYDTPFPENPTPEVLRIIQRHMPDFFPAEMATSTKSHETYNKPEDFDPEKIAPEFWDEEFQTIDIFIDGKNYVDLQISDHRIPLPSPANILLKWSVETKLPEIHTLEALLGDLGDFANAQTGRLTDNETGVSEDIYERSFEIESRDVTDALYWMTYIGERQLSHISPEALDALKQVATITKRKYGIIVRLQEEPFDNDNPEHVQRRLRAEEAMGLLELQKRFPG